MYRPDDRRAGCGPELRAAALVLADHGWPIAPGAFCEAGRWIGLDGAPAGGAGPVVGEIGAGASTGPARASAWWAKAPYSILLVTGAGIDVIEVPAALGRCAAGVLRAFGEVVPIAATPAGQWLFPVRSGGSLHPGLADRAEIVSHGTGGWVTLPPTVLADGGVHWRVPPSTCGWQPAAPSLVHHAVAEAHRLRLRLPSGPGVAVGGGLAVAT